MQDAIAELEEEHRVVVVLRDLEDLSIEEIADITGLPEGTIKSYVNGLLGKLGVRDRTQAATAAIRRGLVKLDEAEKSKDERASLTPES